MASPPEMSRWKVPATRSSRTAPPNRWTADRTAASRLPVTVRSMETTTWLVAGLTPQAVPGNATVRSSESVTDLSCTALYEAPWRAADAGLACAGWATSSAPAARLAAARVTAAGRSEELVSLKGASWGVGTCRGWHIHQAAGPASVRTLVVPYPTGTQGQYRTNA